MPRTKKPQLGKIFGIVGGTNGVPLPLTLPNGTSYNPDKIKIETYRKMLSDYQIAACLNVITFTIQKIDWYFEGGNVDTREFLEYSLEKIWNRLIKGISKAFWAGYSPCTKVFEYDEKIGKINIKKIRDLSPETCKVITDSRGEFNGFVQNDGTNKKEIVPPKYAFWYPNQMIDGNLYGRSLLKPAYNAWYFSELIHLFANRYYERFGEPAVKGKAPNEVIQDKDGNKKYAPDIIQEIAESLKSHSAFTIPAVYDENGNQLYDITYLESTMRGVDFNTYLTRLDMEKARAIFVPDLLLGTGRVGSYELGKEHKATFLTGLMGMMDDVSEYIQKYIVEQLIEINYGQQKEIPQFTYLPLSQINQDLLVNVVSQAVRSDPSILDMKRLAAKLGIPLADAEQIAVDLPENPVSEIPEDEENIQKQKIIKKQFHRVSKYVTDIYSSEDKEKEKLVALESTRIGYPEYFSRRNHQIREKRVKEYLIDSFKKRFSLDEVIIGLKNVIGVKTKSQYVKEEAFKLREKIKRLT